MSLPKPITQLMDRGYPTGWWFPGRPGLDEPEISAHPETRKQNSEKEESGDHDYGRVSSHSILPPSSYSPPGMILVALEPLTGLPELYVHSS
jgi:hypothetical protein